MELSESIESINEQLARHFGLDSSTGRAMFRVVWAKDQFEKRLRSHTPEGFQLIHPQVFEVPKYAKNLQEFYVLERLVIVPAVNVAEIPEDVMSYEPLHHFYARPDANGKREALPPKFYVCKYIIDVMYAAMGKSSLAKYVDEEAKNPIEATAKRIAELEAYLFDDESFLMGRTVTGEAVGYTGEPSIQPVKDGVE